MRRMPCPRNTTGAWQLKCNASIDGHCATPGRHHVSFAPKCVATKQDHAAQAQGAGWTLDGARRMHGRSMYQSWWAYSHGSCGFPLEYWADMCKHRDAELWWRAVIQEGELCHCDSKRRKNLEQRWQQHQDTPAHARHSTRAVGVAIAAAVASQTASMRRITWPGVGFQKRRRQRACGGSPPVHQRAMPPIQ